MNDDATQADQEDGSAADRRVRAALRSADPAATLPPLRDDARGALLEQASSSRRARRPRRPVVLVTGLALAAAVAGAVVLAPRPAVGPDGPAVVLRAGAMDPSISCAPLADFAVQALRGTDLALSGRVESVSASAVEIVPDRVFRGPATGLVRLRTDDAGGPALDGADLRAGEQVLIAASDGQVAACGLSAADSPELRRFYARAFD